MLRNCLFCLLALALPLMGAAQSKSVPYFAQIGGADGLDPDWTVYDVNGDGNTWTNDITTSPGYSKIPGVNVNAGVVYTYSLKNAGDEWLVSPAIHLEAGKMYEISFYSKVSSSKYPENIRLSVSKSNTADAFAMQSETLIDLPNYDKDVFTKQNAYYVAEETGDHYFGIYEYSKKDMFKVYLTAFQVSEKTVTPSPVSNLTATVDENEAVSVDLSWTLPTTDDFGNALECALTGVEVLRDGALVATLDGTATSWQDSEALGLTVGVHTYTVRALIGDAKGADVSVGTDYVGPINSKSVPYFSQIGGEYAFDSGWIVYNVNGDENTWGNDYAPSQYGDIKGVNITAGARYCFNPSYDADDWLVSPAIHLEANKEYRISFYLRTGNSNYKENISLSVGKRITAEAIANEGEILIDLPDYDKDVFTKHGVVYVPKETGNYYFSFHEYSSKSAFNMYVTAFQVSDIITIPSPVSNLTATVDENEAISVNLNWILPTTDDLGDVLEKELTGVEVLRDGELVATLAGTATSWQDSEALGLTGGYHIYTVRALVGAGKSLDTSVKSAYVGPLVPKTLPYFSQLGGENYLDLDWIVHNVNDDDNTWVNDNSSKNGYSNISGVNVTAGVLFHYDSKNNSDDWLVSPAIHLEANKEYRISYYLRSAINTTGLNIRLSVAKNNTADALANEGETLIDLPDSSKDVFTRQSTVFIPKETGNYYFGFYEYTQKLMFNVYITAFQVNENITIPSPVSNLTATIGENEAICVNLNWTLPTTDDVGNPLGSELTGVEVLRDGELVATLAGTATSWQDSEALGLTGGLHTYTVRVLFGEAKSADANVKTAYVGPIVPQSITYLADLSSAEIVNALFTQYHGANSTQTAEWTYHKWDYYGNSIDLVTSTNLVEDEYLVTPPLAVEKSGTIRVLLSLEGSSFGNEKLEVLMGKDKTAEALTIPVTTITNLSSSRNLYETYFQLPETGIYYLGLHACSENVPTSGNTYKVYSLSVEKTYPRPQQITDLEAKPYEDMSLKVNLTWTNPTKNNLNTNLEALSKVTVVRGGEVVKTFDNPIPGAVMQWVDDVPASGIYEYQVLAYSEFGVTLGTPVTVRTTWVGSALDLPYVANIGDSWSSWTIVNVNNDYHIISGKEYAITWETSDNSIFYNSGQIQGDDWAMSPPLQFENGTQLEVEIKSYVSQAESDVAWDVAVAPAIDHTQMVTVRTITTSASASAESSVQTDRLQFIVSNEVQPALPAENEGGEEDPAAIVKVAPGANVIGLHANAIGEIHVKSISIEKMKFDGITDITNSKLAMRVEDGILSVDGASQIAVFDMLGHKVAESTHGEAVNLRGKASGLYVVRAVVNGSLIVDKISK